jgi:hypothetical protein
MIERSDGQTAADLLAAVDRATSELKIELGPVERDLAASVGERLSELDLADTHSAAGTDDFDAALDQRVAQALRALRTLA